MVQTGYVLFFTTLQQNFPFPIFPFKTDKTKLTVSKAGGLQPHSPQGGCWSFFPCVRIKNRVHFKRNKWEVGFTISEMKGIYPQDNKTDLLNLSDAREEMGSLQK